MKSINCQECDQPVANSNNVLARHVRSSHNMDWPTYVVAHELDGKWPTCECGCDEQLPWRKGGFGRFIKGHDNQGEQNPMAVKRAIKDQAIKVIQQMSDGDGWMPNPWTGQEEHVGDGIERDFFMQCVKNDDPVTRDHKFRIGWEDSSGKLHAYSPAFKHIKKQIIFDLGGFADIEGSRRCSAIRDWCDQHGYMMLSLSHSSDGRDLEVVAWHRHK